MKWNKMKLLLFAGRTNKNLTFLFLSAQMSLHRNQMNQRFYRQTTEVINQLTEVSSMIDTVYWFGTNHMYLIFILSVYTPFILSAVALAPPLRNNDWLLWVSFTQSVISYDSQHAFQQTRLMSLFQLQLCLTVIFRPSSSSSSSAPQTLLYFSMC